MVYQVKGKYKQEYILFKHVLKKNFLLQEQVSKLTELMTWENSKNAEYKLKIHELNDKIKLHTGFITNYEVENKKWNK